jgi:hypothetical protein
MSMKRVMQYPISVACERIVCEASAHTSTEQRDKEKSAKAHEIWKDKDKYCRYSVVQAVIEALVK